MKQMFTTGGGVLQTKRYIIPVIFVILLLVITVRLSYAMYSFISTETNGKDILSSKVGLLSYDEAVHAGYTGSYIINNNGYYYNLMSPAGFKTYHGLKLG